MNRSRTPARHVRRGDRRRHPSAGDGVGLRPARALPTSPMTETLPSGWRGDRIRQVLEVVNAGDPSRIDVLVRDAFGGRFRGDSARASTETRSPVSTRAAVGSTSTECAAPPSETPPNRVVVIVKNRLTGGWQGLSLTFDGTPEERITGLQIQPARPPKGTAPPAALTPEQARQNSAPSSTDWPRPRHSPAPPCSRRTARWCSRRREAWPTATTASPCASRASSTGVENKMFTAVVMGQLVDEGRLSFQDPVSKFLGGKGWTKADLSKVRIEHLLSHTSGLGSYFNDTYGAWRASCCARWTTTSRSWPRRRSPSIPGRGGSTAARAPPRRGGHRGGHWPGLLQGGARARLREGGHAEQGTPTISTSLCRTWPSAIRGKERRPARSGGRIASST